MEHIDGAVKVSEITELLRAEYGIVTGEFACYSETRFFFGLFILIFFVCLHRVAPHHISHCVCIASILGIGEEIEAADALFFSLPFLSKYLNICAVPIHGNWLGENKDDVDSIRRSDPIPSHSVSAHTCACGLLITGDEMGTAAELQMYRII